MYGFQCESGLYLSLRRWRASVTFGITCNILSRATSRPRASRRGAAGEQSSGRVLLPQLQNVSHQRNILLFCYHNCRMFLIREIFCSSVSRIAECFSPVAKILFFGSHRNILQFWCHSSRIFLLNATV